MEHATNKDGIAEHVGEWVGILFVFIILYAGLMTTLFIQLESNHGQFERLEAIEFRLDCPEHRQALTFDDEFVCLEIEDES